MPVGVSIDVLLCRVLSLRTLSRPVITNLIYLITCKHCSVQYVGQTKNRLLTRFQGHHFDIQNQNDTISHDTTMNAARFNGLKISVLQFMRSPADSRSGEIERDREDCRWIHRLATVVPQGLNLMDYTFMLNRLSTLAQNRTDLFYTFLTLGMAYKTFLTLGS